MAGFALKYAAVTGQFAKTMEELQIPIAVAATGAIRDVGDWVKVTGRANIAAAKFGKRWQNAFRVNIYPAPSRAASLHPAALAFHRIPYAGIFETGGTIAGSPLLWLPLPNVPTSVLGRHMSPANYIRLIGPLHTIFRPGKPPLLAGYMAGSGDITIGKLVAGNRLISRGGAVRVRSVPLFFGLDRVTLAKRFDLGPIFVKALTLIGPYYLKNLKVK